MARKQITIKDIAQRLNLHHTTVSRALRDHPDISPETKELVLSLAEELDYHPNVIARSFKTSKSKTIGVIVPLIKNDFFSAVISGIEEVACKAGYTITISQSVESYEREIINVRALVSNLIAGLIISVSKTTGKGDHLEILKKRGIPLVFFDRVCEGIEASSVVDDDYNGAMMTVEHLITKGHKNITHFAGPATISVSRLRRNGYLHAMKKHGLQVDEDMIIYNGFEEIDGEKSFEVLMGAGKRPDAIFTVNDPVAFGVYKTMRKYGLKIPADIAIAGFGNNVLSSYLDPALTTVNQSPEKMGKIAARMILNQIENESERPVFEHEVVETELIVREST